MAEPLAGDFDPVALEDWEAKAGDPPRSTTVEDGIEVKWLYTAADKLADDPGGAPGAAPFVRGVRAGKAWDIRQECRRPERATARSQILEDLEGGATGVLLRLDPRFGGRGGVGISTLADLQETLDGVYLDMVTIGLDAGAHGFGAAALLAAADIEQGALRLDPLGTLAAEGTSGLDVAGAARVAAEADALLADVTSLAVDTRAYVNAGATAVQELAIAICTATAYLRACDEAGLPPARAARRLEFTVQVSADQFSEMAKLRALRRLWARVLELAGVPAEDRWSPLYARTAERMLTAVDPWTNMLRVTTAAFAAAVSGADGLTVAPFDSVRQLPGGLGRRIARNTQIVLAEESQLSRVADPGGGSYYVEALTDAYAQAAWKLVGELDGDVTPARVAEMIAAEADRRQDEIARRVRQLTGVNSFPLLDDDGLEPVSGPDLEELAQLDAERLAEAGDRGGDRPATLAEAIEAARDGARIDELVAIESTGEALPVVRDSGRFEALRATDDAPIFLACVGPLAKHSSAQLWARAFFESGGLPAVPSGVTDDLVGEFKASDCKLACVCADPDEDVSHVVADLEEAGAVKVYVAGKDAKDGDDMIALLQDAKEAVR